MATGELKVRAVYTRGLMSMMTLSWQTVGNTFEQTGCPAALLFQEIVLYLHCSQRVVDVFWAPSVWVSARQARVRSHELWEGTQPRPSLVCVCSVCEGDASGLAGRFVPPKLVSLQPAQVGLTIKRMGFSRAPFQSTRLTVIANGLQKYIYLKKTNS